MTTRYAATIRHHSISRAPVVDVGNDLRTAKRRASREFGDGFLDHVIIIYDRQAPRDQPIVTSRRIANRRWDDADQDTPPQSLSSTGTPPRLAQEL